MTNSAPGSIDTAIATPLRWSIAAIAGFVCSFLFVLAPVGIILGIVGIFRTLGGKRRGIGLAVASIPIGLFVGAGSVAVVMSVAYAGRVLALAPGVTSCFEGSRAVVPDLAGKFYESSPKEFRDAVSRERFTGWARSVVEKHGSLQSVDRPRQWFIETPKGMAVSLTGKFVNGPAAILIYVRQNGFDAEILDIEVDGVSAIKGTP